MKPRPFVSLVLCKVKIILIFYKEIKGSLIVTVKVWGGVRGCFSPSRQIYLLSVVVLSLVVLQGVERGEARGLYTVQRSRRLHSHHGGLCGQQSVRLSVRYPLCQQSGRSGQQPRQGGGRRRGRPLPWICAGA